MSIVMYTRALGPSDARAIARVERAAYPASQRSGKKAIRFFLEDIDRPENNFSFGLFQNARLLGFVLAVWRADRKSAFDDFEVSLARDAALSGPSIYVEDVVLSAAGAKHAFYFAEKFTREFRRRAPGVPLDAFCTEELVARWNKFSRVLAVLGFLMDATEQVRDLTADEKWYWVSWTAHSKPRRKPATNNKRPGRQITNDSLPAGYEARIVRTTGDWHRLRHAWDELLHGMTGADSFCTYRFSRTWWNHFGLPNQLTIIVIYKEENVVGIAPLMITPNKKYGRYYRRLEFIGDQSNFERPRFLVHSTCNDAVSAIWSTILVCDSLWDSVRLAEQPLDCLPDVLFDLAAKHDLSLNRGPPILDPHVDVTTGWKNYMQGRSKALRKNLRRKLRKLEALGDIEVRHLRIPGDNDDVLTEYLKVANKGWKVELEVCLERDFATQKFYDELMANSGDDFDWHFRFLTVGKKPVSATFGCLYAGNYSSVEICHDSDYDKYSPGFVLTGLELEYCFDSPTHSEFDFLSGTLDNKSSWATAVRETRDVYLLPRDTHGNLVSYTMFSLKPKLIEFAKKTGTDKFAENVANRLMAIAKR